METLIRNWRTKTLIQLTLLMSLVYTFISYMVFFNSYTLPKLTVPVIHGGKSSGSLSELYRDILHDNVNQDVVKENAKILHGTKEEMMRGEFMDRVNLYLSNLNSFRDVLGQSNPIRLLNFYREVDKKYYASPYIGGPQFTTSHINLLNDKNYCDLADLYFLYSETEHKDLIYFTDYATEGFVRKKVLPKLGYDILPGIPNETDDPDAQRIITLDPSIELFFLKEASFHYFHQININFLCYSQMYNHIPGHEALRSISVLMKLYRNYVDGFSAVEKEKCLPNKIHLPDIFELDDARQRKQFVNEMKTFNSSFVVKRKYKARENYYWVNRWDPEEKDVQEYELNERVANNMITEFNSYHKKQSAMEYFKGKLVQRLVKDPLVLQRNRVHLRAFFFIASTNPLSVYYHSGFATLLPFPEFEEDAQYPTLYPSFEGLALNYDQLPLEDFIDTLFDEGIIKEDIRIEIEDNIKKLLYLVVKAVKSELLVHSSVFELFAVDFMMDKDLNLWLIQVKTSPSLYWLGKKSNVFYENMIKNMMEIELVYQRTKLKAARKFIHTIHEKLSADRKLDYKKYTDEFDKINKNNIDPSEFLKPENKFELLYIEKNKQGKPMYGNVIPSECQKED